VKVSVTYVSFREAIHSPDNTVSEKSWRSGNPKPGLMSLRFIPRILYEAPWVILEDASGLRRRTHESNVLEMQLAEDVAMKAETEKRPGAKVA
jgi:hypothetical protein